jgi:hypothetical protein
VTDAFEGRFDPGKRGRIAAGVLGVPTIICGLWLTLKMPPLTTSAAQTTAAVSSVPVFSGIVSDRTNHKPISDADILVAQGQSRPEVLRSDGHGVFAFQLHQGVVSIRISVSANGICARG